MDEIPVSIDLGWDKVLSLLFSIAFDSGLDSVCLPTVYIQVLITVAGPVRVFKWEIPDQLS